MSISDCSLFSSEDELPLIYELNLCDHCFVPAAVKQCNDSARLATKR